MAKKAPPKPSDLPVRKPKAKAASPPKPKSPPKKRKPRAPKAAPLISSPREEPQRKNTTARTIAGVRIAREKHEQSASLTVRDISMVPMYTNYRPMDLGGINWDRRLACKNDPLLDLRTYFPPVFYFDFGPVHERLIHNIEEKINEGGRKIITMPRGTGKTATCRAMIIRSMKYGLRNFCFFVGSKEPKAVQTLDFIKGQWYRNQLLQQDFPEFAYPIYRIDGRGGPGTAGQIYKGERTHIEWRADEMQLPTLLFTKEDVAGYLEHDPDCVTYIEQYDKYIIRGAGCLVRVAGIDGSIRGEADLHPILLTQPRPDLVLLDDIIRDQKADSLKSCEDLERLIESAVEYLGAPGVSQAVLWPGTVIREGDPTDKYVDPNNKPEWDGERISLIMEYPEGIDDETISDTEQGKLWIEYSQLLETSYRQYGNLKLANEFYIENREVMDRDFQIAWEQHYTQSSPNPDKNEVSAIQHAMNLRFRDHISFLSEAQNRPKARLSEEGFILSPEEVASKVTQIPQNTVTSQWQNAVAFIDVQDEVLFYTVLAFDVDFNGQFIDYGTFPELQVHYLRKSQLASWLPLTRNYYKYHQGEARTAGTSRGKVKAPFDAKLYFALKQCTSWLLGREFPQVDDTNRRLKIRALAIDTRWGQASEIVKRFVRETNDQRIICYNGHPFLPSYKQLEEYEFRPGWLFEHQLHPHVKESKWCIRPYQDGGRYILADVNRFKTFLMKVLATPLGSQGCITLYRGTIDDHRMFADHIASSERPSPLMAKGIIKDCWEVVPNRSNDNDFLDCAAGCLCLASICGASIKTADHQPRKRRSISQAYNRKKGGG